MTSSTTSNNLEFNVRKLLVKWLDSVFGPLYYMTFRIKLSKFQTESPESLLLHSPRSFYESVINVFESELLAESFICTILTYAKKLGMDNITTCSEYITWFKNNDVEKMKSLITSLINLEM